MSKYAGQKKVGNDIAKKLKKEQSNSKSNENKAKRNKLFYYSRLIAKNK